MKKITTTQQIDISDIPSKSLADLEGSDFFRDWLLDSPLPQPDLLPPDLFAFLLEPARYWKVKYVGRPSGPGFIRNATANTIKFIDMEMGQHRNVIDRAINLIDQATSYSATGLLVYMPKYQLYGTYDVDHGAATGFPGATWTDIQENLGLYITGIP